MIIGSSRKYNSFLLVKNYANLPVINSNHITKYIKKRIFNYMLYILSNLQLNFNLSRQTRDYNYSEQGMAKLEKAEIWGLKLVIEPKRTNVMSGSLFDYMQGKIYRYGPSII